MTAVQKAMIGAVLAASIGVGIYESQLAARRRAEVSALERRQAEQDQQSQREKEELALLREEHERSASNVSELAKLRGEVSRLRAKPPGEPLAEARPGAVGSEAAAVVKVPARPGELPKETWTDAGFGTPEAALQTRGWSILNGDRERFKDSIYITDGARKAMEDMLVKMAEKSTEPDKAKVLAEILKNNYGVEEGILMPLMAENQKKKYRGYRIVSQQISTPDEMVMDVETDLGSAPPKDEKLKMRRIGGDWKVVIDEDFVKGAHK